VSVIAGASNMDRRKYFVYNVIGAVIWAGGITMLGYWLGTKVPNIDTYIIPIVVAALVIFYSFGMWHLLKTPQRRRQLKTGLKEDWSYLFGSKKSD
jgi:membrane-associated protein